MSGMSVTGNIRQAKIQGLVQKALRPSHSGLSLLGQVLLPQQFLLFLKGFLPPVGHSCGRTVRKMTVLSSLRRKSGLSRQRGQTVKQKRFGELFFQIDSFVRYLLRLYET